MPKGNVKITASFYSTGGYKKIDLTQWDAELLEIISGMTINEKAGQMVQVEAQDLYAGDVTEFTLGSLMSGASWVPSDNSMEGWAGMVNRLIGESLETPKGIPLIFGLDAVHGNSKAKDSTLLPHNIGLGAIAAGNLQLGKETAYLAGLITAEETLAAGVRWNFAPCAGVADDVRWGRTYECYSSDVEIVTVLGEAVTAGLQDGGLAACLKHYVAEGQTENGKNRGNAVLDEEGIQRILPPYKAGIDLGVMTIMPSFSMLNGIAMHEHKEELQGRVKDSMGFEGFMISDWDAINRPEMTGGVYGSNYKGKLASSINAGVDMIMATGGGRGRWRDTINQIINNVNDGSILEERIDDAVLRILRVKKALDLWNNPVVTAGYIATESNREAARKTVSDSLVLLKNQNNAIQKLPAAERILVAGQGANDIGMQCGGWTLTHQGAHGSITRGVTILEGIRNATAATVTFSEYGTGITGPFDAVIAVIGENPYAEVNGDINSHLSSSPIPLRGTPGGVNPNSSSPGGNFSDVVMLENVYKLKSENTPLVVIMLSGRPMAVNGHIDNWDAFIAAWLPGSEAGDGIADVLFGERDFTGKTPYAWRESEPEGEIIFEFGYGLNKN